MERLRLNSSQDFVAPVCKFKIIIESLSLPYTSGLKLNLQLHPYRNALTVRFAMKHTSRENWVLCVTCTQELDCFAGNSMAIKLLQPAQYS